MKLTRIRLIVSNKCMDTENQTSSQKQKAASLAYHVAYPQRVNI